MAIEIIRTRNDFPQVYCDSVPVDRVVIGLTPTFACVAGQQRRLSHRETPGTFVLAEIEENELGRLLERVAEVAGEYNASEIYASLFDRSLSEFLGTWNEGRRKAHAAQVHLSSAPKLSRDGDISWHVRFLVERLRPDRKTLFLLKGGRLPGYLTRLPQADIPTATGRKFPQVAALGFAVAGCVLLEEEDDIRPAREYDPLNYCNRDSWDDEDYDPFGR